MQCLFMKVRTATCFGGRLHEQKYSPCPSPSRYSATQCSPGLSKPCVLHSKAAGRASILAGSSSLGTMARTGESASESTASRRSNSMSGVHQKS